MNKICTSLEQSKKLIELGIDVETADMIYQPTMDIDSMSNVGFNKIPLCFPFSEVKECNIQYLPAWSLSALLELIPYEIVLDEDESLVLVIHKEDFQYYIEYSNTYSGEIDIDTLLYDDFIDAAFEIVCWLKENGKL